MTSGLFAREHLSLRSPLNPALLWQCVSLPLERLDQLSHSSKIFVLITMERVALCILSHIRKLHSRLSPKNDNYENKIESVIYFVSFSFFSCSISVLVRYIQYSRDPEIQGTTSNNF